MKKYNRIRKNEEFSRIIGNHHSKASNNFIVYASERQEDHTRIGISVSKKLGNAVTRNKIKRQVRMMLQELVDFDENEHDYIVIVRHSYLENAYLENKKDLEKILKTCKIKKKILEVK